MDYDELLRDKRRKDATIEAAKKAGISGAATGGVLGGLGALFSEGRGWGSVAKAALAGAGSYGALSGGTSYLGSQLLGAPDEDDPTAYTRRGAVGGAVGGGAVGAGLGALANKGKLKVPGNSLGSRHLAALLRRLGPKGAAGVGAILGGTTAAYAGVDEGMQVDAYEQEMLKRRRLAIQEAMSQ